MLVSSGQRALRLLEPIPTARPGDDDRLTLQGACREHLATLASEISENHPPPAIYKVRFVGKRRLPACVGMAPQTYLGFGSSPDVRAGPG